MNSQWQTHHVVAATSYLPDVNICDGNDLTVSMFLQEHRYHTRDVLTLELYLVAFHKIFSVCVVTWEEIKIVYSFAYTE